MRINTNIAALNSHRMLERNTNTSAKNLERLSSGMRINRASDDAAGLAISEKMNAQIRGLKMASRNSLDGVSLVQTAEGAMGEIHSMLQRMRELSVQAANGTMSTEDRKAIQDEINQLTSEVNRIGNGTEFNNLQILKGNQGPKSNATVGKMSTGTPAEIITDIVIASPFVTKLDDKELKIDVNGNVNIINLQGFEGAGTTLTKEDLIERIQDGIKDYANIFFDDNDKIVIRSKIAGGDQYINVSGSAADILFDATDVNVNKSGVSENPSRYSTGYLYFDDVPQNGSSLTIGNKKIDFFDSDIAPYAGTNFAVDIKGKTKEQIVESVQSLSIDGVSLFIGDGATTATNLPSPLPADYPVVADFDNDNSRELIIVSHERGFIGNTIALEGTLKEFNVNLQVGSNSGQGFRLEVGDTRSMALKISSDKPTGNPGVAGAAYVKIPNVTNGISSAAVEYSVDVMDEKKATAAIEVYNNAILQVAAERSKLGAIQNRLEKTIANLDNTAENLTGARSRILDTDMALEMSEFTKFNILQQAGTAMLSQANQQPQMMLKLLNA